MFTESFLEILSIAVKNIYNFLYFWYIKSSKDFWKNEVEFMRSVEREIGVMINLKLITQPIFGDYSYVGRFLGPFFRFCRVTVGLMILLISFVFTILIYIIWILLPPVAFYMTLVNIFYLMF